MSVYIALVRSTEAGRYDTSLPDFPDCKATGETIDKSLEAAKIALVSLVADIQSAGGHLPAPRSIYDLRQASAGEIDFSDCVLASIDLAPRSVRR